VHHEHCHDLVALQRLDMEMMDNDAGAADLRAQDTTLSRRDAG